MNRTSRSSLEGEQIIKNYLKSAVVLIVDQNSGARVSLKKILASFGSPIHQIFLAASIEEAEDIIQKEKPNLIFCDYQVEGKYGLDLLQKQRQEHPHETNQCLFILVTGNTSQSAVAQAAEEDIDAYILKPYTIEGFKNTLGRAIQIKIHPSEYLILIREGKELMEKEKLDEALSSFELALTKDPKPALACFYEGLAQFKKTEFDGSEISYLKGLSFSKIHYKCLVGLFDLLMSLKKHEAAYEVVQRIIRFFPANPNRISTVLKLAIQTKHYSDIDTFYQEFLKIEKRNDELVKCVCAALIVCGKFFLENSETEKGLSLIQKASVTAAGNHFILRKAIETLVQYNQVDEATSLTKRFSSPSESDSNYGISLLLIANKNSKPDLVAYRGLELLKKGIIEREVYEITINNLEKIGSEARARELKEEAIKNFPEMIHERQKAS